MEMVVSAPPHMKFVFLDNCILCSNDRTYTQSIVNQQSTTALLSQSSSDHSKCKDHRPKDVDPARLASTLLGELCTILLNVYPHCRMKFCYVISVIHSRNI